MNETTEKNSSSMGDMMAKLAKEMEELRRVWKFMDEIPFPVQVKNVTRANPVRNNSIKPGHPVSVRPCGNKTYFGIHLGDLPVGSFNLAWNVETNELRIMSDMNPAIYVPDLGKIVWGFESWWGPIESEEALKEITDDTISQQWYVRAMKALVEKQISEQGSTTKEEK